MNGFGTCVFGLFCAAAFAGNAVRSSAGQQSTTYDEGQTAYRAKRFAAAAELWARAEAEAPGKTDALLLQAKALIEIQQFSSAEIALRSYLGTHPRSDETLSHLGYVLNRLNRPAESLNTYTDLARLRTPVGDELKMVGLDYVLLQDVAVAIHWLEKAVELDPPNREAWYFLGRAYFTATRLREAKEAFLRTLKLDPRNAKAENYLGLILQSENRVDEAAAAFQASIDWQSESAHPSEQPYLNLGTLLGEQGKPSEAVPLLERALRIDPRSVPAHIGLGRAFLQLGHSREAQTEFELALELEPGNASAHFQLGRTYKQLGLVDKAQAEFRRTADLLGTRASPVD